MRALVARVLVAVAACLAVYVVYVHAAEWRRGREYLEDPLPIRFEGNTWARGLDVTSAGAFDVTSEGGEIGRAHV